MLNHYLQMVQRFVGYDEHQDLYNPDDLIEFINIARAEVAAQGQCIRGLTSPSGGIIQGVVNTGGSGYTSPSVSISVPDLPPGSLPAPFGQQAQALAQQIGGVVSDVAIEVGGSGYYAPSGSIVDPTGSGATVSFQTNPVTTTQAGQEVYRFSDIDLSGQPGVGSILTVLSINLIWGNWQWELSRCSLSKYMALIRQFTTNFLAPPVWAAKVGQGTMGSFMLYPIPDTNYPMLFDCIFLPMDLDDDLQFEPIPKPWTKAVPYYAAHLALLSQAAKVPQLLPLANQYFNEKTGGLFGTMMRRARAFSDPGWSTSFYGRG